ncbi:hypothetical protein F2P79_006529 [Pimephales promelas]|nr:hypothetical protein F2P79_006529 [Pimephales promelas]
MFLDCGGNRSKPTQTQGEHANSTQKVLLLLSRCVCDPEEADTLQREFQRSVHSGCLPVQSPKQQHDCSVFVWRAVWLYSPQALRLKRSGFVPTRRE